MVTPAPRLLYVSDLVPRPGQGGQIVLDRHLRRLAADGWTLDLVTSSPCPDGPWRAHVLPARRAWWPPFRPARPWLARLRARAWARELRSLPRPDVILTVTGSHLSWLAAHVSERDRAPLAAIVHDHWRECGSPDDERVADHVCRRAAALLAVGEEMRASLAAEFGHAKATVLPPLPSSRQLAFAAWRESHARAPMLAHVGALHNYHVPFLSQAARALAALGGRLLVLCPADNPALRALHAEAPGLWHQPFFPSNADALRFVSERASGLVVMYPFRAARDGSPLTGFPSRFVEFVHLGLPILVAAPEGNPIRNWSARQDWPSRFDPDDTSTLAEACGRLTRPADWQELARASRTVAGGEFDPDRIHSAFRSTLLALITSRAT